MPNIADTLRWRMRTDVATQRLLQPWEEQFKWSSRDKIQIVQNLTRKKMEKIIIKNSFMEFCL